MPAIGRTVEIRGTVGGDLRAAARTIVLAGTVGGSADLKADEIIIEPGARIAGELTVRSPTRPVVPASAAIAGPVNYVAAPPAFPMESLGLGLLCALLLPLLGAALMVSLIGIPAAIVLLAALPTLGAAVNRDRLTS